MPVTITSNSPPRGMRAMVSATTLRRSGTTVRLRSLVLLGVKAPMRNVVRRSLLTKVDSPMVRTDTTWLM